MKTIEGNTALGRLFNGVTECEKYGNSINQGMNEGLDCKGVENVLLSVPLVNSA